jgi:hypothetical protein
VRAEWRNYRQRRCKDREAYRSAHSFPIPESSYAWTKQHNINGLGLQIEKLS